MCLRRYRRHQNLRRMSSRLGALNWSTLGVAKKLVQFDFKLVKMAVELPDNTGCRSTVCNLGATGRQESEGSPARNPVKIAMLIGISL